MSAIRKRSQALQPVTARPQISTVSEWSQHHLLTLRKSIDDSSYSNTQVRQQLKMQRQNSNQFLSQIRTSMLNTEQSGIDLIARLQEEVCKNEQLTHLVKHYQQQIQLEKEEEHQKQMNNIQTYEYDQLNIELAHKQKILQTVTNKLNSFQSETMSSYELVKAERRQRTVFSNQFNKFENEMFSLEEKYKQFLIERILLEKTFDQSKAEFIKMQNDTLKKADEINLEQKGKRISTAKQRESQIREPKDYKEYKEYTQKTTYNQSRFQTQITEPEPRVLLNGNWHEPQSYRVKKDEGLDLLVEPSFIKSRSRLTRLEKNDTFTKNFLSELNEKKLTNLEYKKKIQTFLNDLGLASVKELKKIVRKTHSSKDEYMYEMNQLNHKKHEDIKSLEETIGEWQTKINELKQTIKALPLKPKRTKSQALFLSHLKTIRRLVQNTAYEVKQIQEEIVEFKDSENLNLLMKSLEINVVDAQSQHEAGETEIDPNLMSQVEEKLFALMGNTRWPESKPKQRQQNIRKSFIFESILTHPAQKESMINTQRTICPLLSPPSNLRNSKRLKTSACQSSEFKPLKKMSNLVRNQSRFKGPVDVASKEQLITEATKAFGKEGIYRQDKFYVNYS